MVHNALGFCILHHFVTTFYLMVHSKCIWRKWSLFTGFDNVIYCSMKRCNNNHQKPTTYRANMGVLHPATINANNTWHINEQFMLYFVHYIYLKILSFDFEYCWHAVHNHMFAQTADRKITHPHSNHTFIIDLQGHCPMLYIEQTHVSFINI